MSSHTSHGALIVIGSGPGIGSHVASLFASRGFNHVVLLARNAERLEEDKAKVLAEAGRDVKVDTVRSDISDTASVKQALKKIDELVDSIECVLFNAARVAPSAFFDFPAEEIEKDFRTTTIALYTVAQWIVPRLLKLAASSPSAKPSLLVTNNILYNDPIPQLFSLCLVKIAQRNLVQSLTKTYNHEGIHIALISVGGEVTPSAKQLNPSNIAEKTWELLDQEKGKQTLEIEIVEG